MISFNNLNIRIDSGYLWGILAFFLCFYIVMALILKYHWDKYITNPSVKNRVMALFWFVSFALFLLCTLSLLILN